MKQRLSVLGVLLLLISSAHLSAKEANERPDVLFIAVEESHFLAVGPRIESLEHSPR